MPIFTRKIYTQNKHKGKKIKKVNEAKTVGNIKCKPILSQLVL